VSFAYSYYYDVPDTEQVGSVGDFCISDEVMPAYPEDHTYAGSACAWKASSFRKSSCRSVHLPNHTIGWTISGISGVRLQLKPRLSPDSVLRLHESANPSKNIWLTPPVLPVVD